MEGGGADQTRTALSLNGQLLSNPRSLPFQDKSEEEWTEFKTRALRKGTNIFQVRVEPPRAGESSKPMILNQVMVLIEYS